MMRIEKGQSTVELMVVLAIALVLLAFLINFTTTQLQQLQKAQAVKTAQNAADELVNAANIAFAQGAGTIQTIEIHLPSGIDSSRSRIEGKSIVFSIYDTDVVATANIPLSGSIPTSNGARNVFVTATSNGVSFGTNYISASAATIYVPMARDTNQLIQVILSNSSTDVAAIATSLSWSHTPVNASVSTSGASINGNGTLNVDFNAVALASAIGNYTGVLTITATFPSSVETLNIPINVEVFANTGTLMNVVPNSLYFSTIGADSNSLSIQICNTGNSNLKNISFIPSSGNAGNWIQSISQISSLAAQSCTSKDVTITVPVATPYGFYTGSMAVVDFSGANSQIIPISIDVFGQSNAFFWDWNGTISGGTELTYFGLSNKSSGALTVKSIILSRWWACDTFHSQLTGMMVDSSNVYSGSALDENEWMDVDDFTIPGNTSYTVNRLYFSGNVTNEGEQFQSLVTFEDDSNYTSTIYGSGCAFDLIPPGTVTNLTAVPGPVGGAITLNFTSPGDDNFSGRAVGIDARYSTSNIASDTDYNNALQYDTDWNAPSGGTLSSIVINNLSVAKTYYSALKFFDEVPIYSSRSNTAGPFLAWDRFQYGLGQFPIGFIPNSSKANTFETYNIPDACIVNADCAPTFCVSGYCTAGPSNEIALRIVDEEDEANNWVVDLNFDSNYLVGWRIWYPGRIGPSFPEGNDIDQLGIPTAEGIDLSGSPIVDLLDGSLFGDYAYNGSTVNIGSSNRAYLIALNGYADANVKVN